MWPVVNVQDLTFQKRTILENLVKTESPGGGGGESRSLLIGTLYKTTLFLRYTGSLLTKVLVQGEVEKVHNGYCECFLLFRENCVVKLVQVRRISIIRLKKTISSICTRDFFLYQFFRGGSGKVPGRDERSTRGKSRTKLISRHTVVGQSKSTLSLTGFRSLLDGSLGSYSHFNSLHEGSCFEQ